MKKVTLFLIATMMLVACGGSKPSASSDEESEDTSSSVDSTVVENDMPPYDITDARAMGLNGHVQSVSLQRYSTYESNGELKDGILMGQCEIVFDASGHMTSDEWGNEYGYNAEGNYYRGNHTYTTVKRDKAGRIIEYNDIEPNKDNESQFVQSFQYDKNGRITSIKYCGGFTSVWTEKRHYNSGKIYPAKMKCSVTFEGGGAQETVVTYRYTSFDDHNNWTERLCMVSTKEMEELVDSVMPQQSKLKEEIQVEKRVISYFE